jgi:aspartyl-tRNA(Asn)/glutamyl-tRNA(Gln) amidotransferase subunit B
VVAEDPRGRQLTCPVIGLEIHVQLATRTRLFSNCARAADTSVPPNQLTDPVTLGLPGTLPVLNRRAVELALRVGVALDGEIARQSRFDRKHYFYPDLPRNFQITQDREPLIRGGRVLYEIDGEVRSLKLTRCHLEEDAGRSVHADSRTRVDFNRAGVGLLEIVTEPELHEAREAVAVVDALRELVRWIGVSHGELEQGHMRCDANISLRDESRGMTGARVELKNLNSIRGVGRALESEIARQKELRASGAIVQAQTRGWDADRGTSFAQRGKEATADYRFMPEPDLGPLVVDESMLEDAQLAVGELPLATRLRWRAAGMDAESARVLSSSSARVEWCDRFLCHGVPVAEFGRWASGDLLHRARSAGLELPQLPWSVEALVELIGDAAARRRSVSEARVLLDEAGAGDLEAVLLAHPAGGDEPIDEALLRGLLERHREQVEQYRGGKQGVLGWFVAEARRQWPHYRDPASLASTLRRLLSGNDR